MDAQSVQLSHEEIRRYSRHLIMPEVGMTGQKKLKAASVLTVGAGGLGSPLAMYLAAAGVGRIGVVDFDVVDESNLQRQIIHGQSALGQPKRESAKARLLDINPHIQVDTYGEPLTSANALDILRDYDIVVDGTDNFQTRYLVNDACVLLGKPNVYGSIFRFEGQASVFYAKEGPCYRCLYPEPPPPGLVPSCAEGGVLGVLPGVIGTIQATEAIKLIIGVGELIDYEQFGGRAAVPPEPLPTSSDRDITVEELKRKIDARERNLFVLDVREPQEFEICRIPGAVLIPLGEVLRRVGELDPSKEIVVQCKMGGRSAKAAEILRASGFPNVKNLTGGILAWIDRVDPSQPKY